MCSHDFSHFSLSVFYIHTFEDGKSQPYTPLSAAQFLLLQPQFIIGFPAMASKRCHKRKGVGGRMTICFCKILVTCYNYVKYETSNTSYSLSINQSEVRDIEHWRHKTWAFQVAHVQLPTMPCKVMATLAQALHHAN